MEKVVYNYIVQTSFYQNNKDRLEIIPQFDVGKYIKQLDPYVKISNYRTDFLLIFKDRQGEQFIIIEYDGFEYHFIHDYNYIDELNYEKYYIESDIERQKTIELYGYRFIRINKFNLRDNTVEKLNSRLEKIVKVKKHDSTLNEVNNTYEKIQKKEYKIYIRCGKVKPQEEFFDSRLKSGIGRICMECKIKRKSRS